jgi:hypothetical protein
VPTAGTVGYAGLARKVTAGTGVGKELVGTREDTDEARAEAGVAGSVGVGVGVGITLVNVAVVRGMFGKPVGKRVAVLNKDGIDAAGSAMVRWI